MAYEFPEDPQQASRALTSMTYLLLATNSIGTVVRAYSSGNNWFLAFILYIYLSFLLLECCYRAYHRLPRGQKSARKNFLAVAICCLFSGIIFGFVHQLAPYFNLVFAVTMYAIAFAGSATMFYVYIIHSDTAGTGDQCYDKCCNNNNKNKNNNNNNNNNTFATAGGESEMRFTGGHVEIIFEKV